MPILILYMMFYVTYTTSFAPMCCFAPERPVMLCDIELLFASSRCVITSYRVCLRSQEVSDDILGPNQLSKQGLTGEKSIGK